MDNDKRLDSILNLLNNLNNSDDIFKQLPDILSYLSSTTQKKSNVSKSAPVANNLGNNKKDLNNSSQNNIQASIVSSNTKKETNNKLELNDTSKNSVDMTTPPISFSNIDTIKNGLLQLFSCYTNDNLTKNLSTIYSSMYSEEDFMNITPYSGFDKNDPQNARQNNYAWSFEDFNDYIYVGTGRNLSYISMSSSMKDVSIPLDYTPSKLDMGTEIWRFKKDGTLPWQRVYKSPIDDITKKPKFIGIRSIVKFESFKIKPALYAAAYSMSGISILKSTNGVDWFDIPTNIKKGTSSRSMLVYDNKLYLTVMADGEELPSLLYSTKDPELYGWTLETPEGEKNKNPIGTIWSIATFNNHLYLGTSGKDGFNVWRTNGRYPKVNDWKLVIDNGAGDAANATCITLTEFKDHLYVGTAYNTTDFISYIIPKGAEIISIDKKDNWKIIVGGPPFKPIRTKTCKRNIPLSELNNGFNNPYNIYMWQMKVYDNKLFVGTYDSSISVEPTLELMLKNKEYLSNMFGKKLIEIYILLLKIQTKILSKVKDRLGFDLYVTDDGINYELISFNGLSNPYNYGARNIFITSDKSMYLGTANPFTGCEVFKLIKCDTII